MKARRIITIFGGSRCGPQDDEYITAQELGTGLARAGFAICNGGYGGTMEAAARGARGAAGHTIGITTSFYSGAEANPWIQEVVQVPTPHDRLMKLIQTGDGYAVLKGGTGTLLELAASWEYINKGVIPPKPIVVVGDFWNGVIETLKKELAWEGLEACTRFVSAAATPAECVRMLEKWVSENSK